MVGLYILERAAPRCISPKAVKRDEKFGSIRAHILSSINAFRSTSGQGDRKAAHHCVSRIASPSSFVA